MIGTYDSNGKANVSDVAGVGFCCFKSPCVAMREVDYFGTISGQGCGQVQRNRSNQREEWKDGLNDVEKIKLLIFTPDTAGYC